MGAELLKRLNCPPQAERIVHSIEQSAKRGALLVRQVLSFARGIEGARVPVNIADITAEIESIACDTFPRNISVERSVAKGLLPLRGDPTQIHQILLNLMVNSRDAMPNGGTIKLTAENFTVAEALEPRMGVLKPGNYLLLIVSDTGLPWYWKLSDQ